MAERDEVNDAIYIPKLPEGYTKDKLAIKLKEFGNVKKIYQKNHSVGDGHMYFCEFYDPSAAKMAVDTINKNNCFKFKINFANRNRTYNRTANSVSHDNENKDVLNDSDSNSITGCQKQFFAVIKQSIKQIKNINKCSCSDRNEYFEDLVEECNMSDENIMINYIMKICPNCGQCSCSAYRMKSSHLNNKNHRPIYENKQPIISNGNKHSSIKSAVNSNDDKGELYSEKTLKDYSINKSLNFSPLSKLRSIVLLLIEDPLFESGAQIAIEIEKRVNDSKYFGTAVPKYLSEVYNSFKNNFSKECNELLNKNETFVLRRNDLLAISIKRGEDIEWRRAYMINNYKYALIDAGLHIYKQIVINVIPCPETYANMPMFACRLIMDSHDLKDDRLTRCYGSRMIKKENSYCIISIDKGKGLLLPWNFQMNAKNSNKKLPLKNNVPNNEMYGSKHVSLPPVELNNDSVVKIVNYENASNIYVRLEGTDDTYRMLLNRAYRDGYLGANVLKNKPKRCTRVLCVYDNKYCRGIVSDYNESDDMYDICLVDIGKSLRAKLEELKECSESLSNHPIMITKVSLKNAAEMKNYEPSEKVMLLVDQYIREKVSFNCQFVKNTATKCVELTLLNDETKLSDILLEKAKSK